MLKNKVSRAIALVSSVCCLGGAVVGLTVYAVNSNFDAQAVDTAYGEGGSSSQQYVIRFKEPTGVTFSLQSKRRKTFSSYIGKDQSAIAAELQSDYAILDIKKYENGVPDGETWYDIAVDEETFSSSKVNSFDFYCAYNSTVQSVSLSYDNGGTSSDLYNEGGYYVLFSDSWTANQVPVVTATATYKKTVYTVTPNSGNFSFNGNATATEGEDYRFTITPDSAGYDVTVKYSVNSGEQKDARGSLAGGYYIPKEDITGNIEITITLEATKYTVSFQNPIGAYFAKANGEGNYDPIEAPLSLSAEESASAKVRLIAETGYSVQNAQIYQGGTRLSGSGNEEYIDFTLNSVSSDVMVTVSSNSVVKKQITVTTPAKESQQGYTFSGNATVAYGENYSFTVTPDAGKEVTVTYSMGEVKNETLTPVNRVNYSVQNVTDGLTIEVTPKDITYSLNFPSDQPGYEIYDWTEGEQGDQLSGGVDKKYGELKFKITVRPGYKGTPTVAFTPLSGSRQSLSLGDDGLYTLAVNSNGTISVSGITQEFYSVTVVGAEGMTNYHYSSSGSTTNLTYGMTFHFTVTADEGYAVDGYSVTATKTGKTDETVTVTPAQGQTKQTNFSVLIEGNVTLTLQQLEGEHREKRNVKYLDSHANYKVQIQQDGEFKDLGEGTTVLYNEPLTFQIVADGYSVSSVLPTSSHETSTKVYLIEHVTTDVNISATLRENTLTIIYQNASGLQVGASQTITYSRLGNATLRDVNAIDPVNYSYIVKEWYRDGAKCDDDLLSNAAKDAMKDVSVEWHLQLHYALNTENAQELLTSFYAYYRDDADRKEDGKKYFIYRMEIDGTEWTKFFNEMNLVNATLSAVGFNFSNTDVLVSPHGLTEFTTEDIAGKYSSMVSATSTEAQYIDERTGDDGAWLRLCGYQWREDDERENQVQFISTTTSKPRYFRGWFMISIYGETTVVMAEQYQKVTTDNPTSGLKPSPALAPAEVKIEMSENEESPTIE